MADLAATDVSYSITKIKKLSDGRKIVQATLTFGDGALTYPTGGVPLTKGKLGLPTSVDSFVVEDRGTSGYAFSYDKTNEKLRAFQGAAHTHPLTLKNAAVADGASARVNAGTNLLGANTGADLTIAGGGANGGIQLSTAAGGSELVNSVAPAAQTLKVTAIGW